MAITETDIESGEEEEDGNKSQKEQEEELQKAKKKQVLSHNYLYFYLWLHHGRFSFLDILLGHARYFGSNSALIVVLVT